MLFIQVALDSSREALSAIQEKYSTQCCAGIARFLNISTIRKISLIFEGSLPKVNLTDRATTCAITGRPAVFGDFLSRPERMKRHLEP